MKPRACSTIRRRSRRRLQGKLGIKWTTVGGPSNGGLSPAERIRRILEADSSLIHDQISASASKRSSRWTALERFEQSLLLLPRSSAGQFGPAATNSHSSLLPFLTTAGLPGTPAPLIFKTWNSTRLVPRGERPVCGSSRRVFPRPSNRHGQSRVRCRDLLQAPPLSC